MYRDSVLIRFLVAVVLVASMFGCAAKSEYITLQYDARAGVAPLESAGKVALDIRVTDKRCMEPPGTAGWFSCRP